MSGYFKKFYKQLNDAEDELDVMETMESVWYYTERVVRLTRQESRILMSMAKMILN